MRKRPLAIFLIIFVTSLLVACGDTSPTNAPAPTTVATTTTSAVSNTPATTAITTTATTNPTQVVTTSPTTTLVATTHPTQNALPDKIAYNTFDSNGKPEVYVINPDGTGKVKIGQGRSPLFSPDGKQVAFLASLDKVGPSGFNQVGIYTTNLDGSNKKLYCSGDGNAQLDLVRWSPRNRYIIMNGTQNGPGKLFFCNLADGQYSNVFGDKSGAASKVFDWTADGENALWQAGENYANFNLYYGDPDKGGKGATQLTNGQSRFSELGYYLYGRFSPDGKTIAVGGDKIFFISAPGHKSPLEGKVIGGISSYLTGLVWSPDGKAVAYSEWDKKTVKIVDIASGKITTLENTGFLGDWSHQ